MGVMLSVLVASVGAMDLIYCLAYVSNQVPETDLAITSGDEGAVSAGKSQELDQFRASVRQQIEEAPRSTVEGVTYAQDGVAHRDGYRLEPSEGSVQLDELLVKLRVLERKSQEKDRQLEQMSVQMSELEQSTVEQSLIIEELRSRSVSRAHSVEPPAVHRTALSPTDAVPQIVLNAPTSEGGNVNASLTEEPRPSSSKFRPIRRDDGLRRSVKRRSVTSVTSQEDRTDELERLSQLEDEECAQMDDYIPIVYNRDEHDPLNRRHNISPIPESCLHHEDDERQWVPERSPEPTLAANITRPWGDIKLGEMKEKAVLRPSRSMSIEEEDAVEGAPAVVKLHVTETKSAPCRSSHSSTPERTSGEPTLRRTTKEADLTSLLGAPESKASRTTEIIVQSADESEDEQEQDEEREYGGSDSDGTARPRAIPQFMQSKSPSPYADGQTGFLAHERLPLADISNRLVPLVAPSVSYPSRPRSPTPYDEPGSSRESTPTTTTSLLPSLGKLPNGSVSRDSSISPSHPARQQRTPPCMSSSSSSSSLASLPVPVPARSPSADRQSGDRSRSGVSPVSDAERLLLEVDAGTEGDTECDNEQQLLSVPTLGGQPRSKSSSRGPSPSASPRRKFKERKRVARSLTPIDFDQTFMDNFADQHLSVSPSELEDYINSMDEIRFVPPPLVKPSYLYPRAPPSLVLTDELGTDAQFHDELSSKAFYGQSHPHSGIELNHRVSYVEWIKKFPDNQTSHLALEDFDSDDEEVESIIRQAKDENKPLFPTDVPKSAGNTPQPSKPEMPPTPENAMKTGNTDGRNEFPTNVTPAYATPSPVSLVSDLSDLSSPTSEISQSSLPSQSLSSSLALGSPLLSSCHDNPPPAHHFTPIPSPSLTLSSESDAQQPALQSRTSPQTNTPLRPTLILPPGVASRTPSVSPLPVDISAEELVFEIGHLDGLIFEARSREPTPARSTSRNDQLPLLSPDELAFDIGNMGGLILGPPSRGASPIPPPSPTPSAGSPLPSSWVAIDQHGGETLTSAAPHNNTQ
ncbi:histone-lysine N-methyltransferase 2D-like [Anopheles nili]|uniref:histone-lysine N-methyltransferase 2D-like n=1 Tax=Anopheles nili TaxID=185578 RepID=UPI00237B8F19|nr:histone-lysine N-methyltransferase 2D-like [Anopheles nili]